MLLNPPVLYAQKPSTSSTWKKMADVKFKIKTVNQQKISYPEFGPQAKSLDQKTILLKGYILPLDLENDTKFIFSLLPYNSCFFCGGAGPETVLEVYPKSKIAFSEKPIYIKGKLKLNPDDPSQLMYIMTEAVQKRAF